MSLSLLALGFSISLSGILFGILLSHLAPEEIAPGKKYFLLIKKVLGLMIIGVSGYLIYSDKNYWLAPVALVAIMLVLQKKISWPLEITAYLLFFVPYLFSSQEGPRLLLAALIFCYGLPAGTLLRGNIVK